MDKSKLDWEKFKTTAKDTEELEHHKKNGYAHLLRLRCHGLIPLLPDRYLEKVAFLQRTDVRQYELERQQRQGVREKKNQG